MTANNKAKNEFKAVAREAAQLGARFVGVTREWFDSRRQEAERPSGYYSRKATSGRPADDDERTYGRDEHASTASTASTGAGKSSGYRGIGPRGYTRSDERIREDVCETLCDCDQLDAADINVDVTGGAVRLSGTVPHRAMKHRAEDLAESCSGVRDIENAIRVAGVDPVGGASSYRGGGTSHGGTSGGTAYGSGTAGSTSAAAGNTSGYGQGTTGATTPSQTGSGTGAGSGTGSSAGTGTDARSGAGTGSGSSTGTGTGSGAGTMGGQRPDRAG